MPLVEIESPTTCVSPKLLEQVPTEIALHIIALAGVRTCAITRNLAALERIVHAACRSRRAEDAALKTCWRYRWSDGIALLVDRDFEQSLAHWPQRRDVERIVLPTATICKLWRARPRIPDDTLACLVYNAKDDATGNIVQWCSERDRPFLGLLGMELLRRGGNFQDLQALCRRAGFDMDEHDVAWQFVRSAAQCGRLDVLQAMDRVSPDSVWMQEKLLADVASSGDIATIKFVFARSMRGNCGEAVTAAMAAGRAEAAKWLIDHRPTPRMRIDMEEAARGGLCKLFKHIRKSLLLDEKQRVLLPAHVTIATEGNYHEMLQWILETDPSCMPPSLPAGVFRKMSHLVFRCLLEHAPQEQRPTLINHAARAERWSLVRWAVDAHPHSCPSDLPVHALGRGRRDIAVWISQHLQTSLETAEQTRRSDIAALLCQTGQLCSLQDLFGRAPFDVTPALLVQAVQGGNVELARWLCDMQPSLKVTTAMLSTMIDGGDVAMLQWALSLPDTESLPADGIDRAAATGRLPMVQWLHDNTHLNGTVVAMDVAVRQGRLDLVRFLHGNQPGSHSQQAMVLAAGGGFLDIVQWLHATGHYACTAQAIDDAAAHGHLHVVRWLHQNRHEGCTTAAMDLAAASGYLDILKYLHAHRREGCTQTAMNEAVRGGHIECVKWLHLNRKEGSSPDVMKWAANEGHLAVVKFLHNHGYPSCTWKDVVYAPPNVRDWLDDIRSGTLYGKPNAGMHMENMPRAE
ncbi:hypothetical protein RI367_004077 [Sorochytrium milnesiophthora]